MKTISYVMNVSVEDNYIYFFLFLSRLKEKVLQRLNKHHNQQALTSSIEEGLKLQAINRAQRVVCNMLFHLQLFRI